MSRYSQFFLSTNTSTMEYETIELSHPNFSQVYYLVRNNPSGITATDEDSNVRVWTYTPMLIAPSGADVDLDFGITITLGDLGEILPTELDNVAAITDGMLTKPVVIYRTFESSDLTSPLTGPFTLEIVEFSFDGQGCVFQCRPPSANRNRTGMAYLSSFFPSLRGFR